MTDWDGAEKPQLPAEVTWAAVLVQGPGRPQQHEKSCIRVLRPKKVGILEAMACRILMFMSPFGLYFGTPFMVPNPQHHQLPFKTNLKII